MVCAFTAPIGACAVEDLVLSAVILKRGGLAILTPVCSTSLTVISSSTSVELAPGACGNPKANDTVVMKNIAVLIRNFIVECASAKLTVEVVGRVPNNQWI